MEEIMSGFEVKKGGKFDFIEKKEARDCINEAGNRKIIFVEGKDDVILYSILYKEKINRIAFIEAGNCIKVKDAILKIKEDKEKLFSDRDRYFGIIDRDFRTDEERAAELEKVSDLHIHSRYTLENYFIEPYIIEELLKTRNCYLKIRLEEVKEIIEKILQELIETAVYNWVLKEYGKKFLPYNVENDKLDFYLNSNKVEDIKDSIKNKIELKREIIRGTKNLQEYINGKNIIYKLVKYFENNEEFPKFNNTDDLGLKREMARILKDGNGISELNKFIDEYVIN
jgi:hypothetical protein